MPARERVDTEHTVKTGTSAVGSSAVGSSDQDRRSAKLLGRVDIPLKALGAVSAEPGMRLSEALLGAIQPGSQGSQAGTDSRRPSATGEGGLSRPFFVGPCTLWPLLLWLHACDSR